MSSTAGTTTDYSSHFKPIWISATEIDPGWLNSKISRDSFKGGTVEKVIARDISNQSRKGDEVKNGATLSLQLFFNAKNNAQASGMSIVLKQVPPSGQQLSRQLGLAREALFYSQLAPQLKVATANYQEQEGGDKETVETDPKIVPVIYYSWGDPETGEKVVLMEDLGEKFVDSGILFGPGNPNNWSRDLPVLVSKAYKELSPPSSYQVAHVTFQAIAKVHATFWRDSKLLESGDWLRGGAWVQGQNKESWEASQRLVQNFWEQTVLKEKETGVPRLKWDPVVKETAMLSVQNISWEAQLDRLNTNTNWTLVHGDFWPGNVMLSPTAHIGQHTLRLLDWEMTGIGSGPQDLGQYVISNMDPTERRDCEYQLVQDYYKELVRLGVKDFSWKDCWKEYRIGGLERWLWFLVYFCGQEEENLPGWAQFFHDQISSFIMDHQISPSDVVQPRP